MVFEMTTDAAAGVFRALGDPVRLRVLSLLEDGQRCVCDLLVDLDMAPSLLSYHLRVLKDAGLVEATRRGKWIDYRLAPGALDEVRRMIPGGGR